MCCCFFMLIQINKYLVQDVIKVFKPYWIIKLDLNIGIYFLPRSEIYFNIQISFYNPIHGLKPYIITSLAIFPIQLVLQQSVLKYPYYIPCTGGDMCTGLQIDDKSMKLWLLMFSGMLNLKIHFSNILRTKLLLYIYLCF